MTNQLLSKNKIIVLFVLSFTLVSSTGAWAALTKSQVSQLYVSLFGRASEGAGNQYWQKISLSMAQVADLMLDTQPSREYFGEALQSNQTFIEHIYRNTLNKTPDMDAEGIDYWKTKLDEGMPRGQVVVQMIHAIGTYGPGGSQYASAMPRDISAYYQFAHRVLISNYMADTVWRLPENWQIVTSFTGTLIVTDDDDCIDPAKAAIDRLANTGVDPGFVTETKLNLAPPVQVGNVIVPDEGGTISITYPGDPMNGLKVGVPGNAYAGDKKFSFSYETIQSISGNDDLHPVTPLICIKNGGDYANEVMSVKIPVKIEPGYHYMAFYYDEDTGFLEGIPELTHDATSLTVITRHFSKFFINRLKESVEQLFLSPPLDSGYRPTVDNWNFTNPGAYFSPEGMCSGMSASSVYYYIIKKILVSRNALDSGPGNQLQALYSRFGGQWDDFDLDNAAAIKFTSLLQKDFEEDEGLYDKWYERGENNPPLWTFLRFIHAMKVTRMPQLVAVYPDNGKGHALVVYKIHGTRLYVADPNFPKATDIFLELRWDKEHKHGEWIPFTGRWNIGSSSAIFTKVHYYGTSALVPWNSIKTRYQSLEKGTIGNGEYPAIDVTVVEMKNKKEIKTHPLSRDQASLTTSSEFIKLKVDCHDLSARGVEIRDNWYLYDAQLRTVIRLEKGKAFSLNHFSSGTGRNLLGIHLEAKVNEQWTWAGFRFVKINYDPDPSQKCHDGEEWIDGKCVPIGCTRVCKNPIISNQITFPGYGGNHTITFKFKRIYKMCTKEIDNPDSMNGKTTMLFFYKSDGSGDYFQPVGMVSGRYEFAKAEVSVGGKIKASMSPLPDYNSATHRYYHAEEKFGFDITNFDDVKRGNKYDFLWIMPSKAPRTIINPEWVDANGCYSGNF